MATGQRPIRSSDLPKQDGPGNPGGWKTQAPVVGLRRKLPAFAGAKYPGGNFREHMLTQNLEAFRTHCAIPMASLLRRSSVRGHRSEIMFGVLVVVFCPDYVAALGFSLGERQIPLIVSLRVVRALLFGAGRIR